MAPSPRLYERWEGNNRFLCGGRLMLGAQSHQALGTAMLVCTPLLALGLAEWEYHDLRGHEWRLYVAVAAGACSEVFLFLTATSDPGVALRSRDPSMEQYDSYTKKRMKINDQLYWSKFCRTCNIFRLPRMSHCPICNNCVAAFDHHCPWVGTCIGARNYRSFLGFVMCTAFVIVWCLVFCIKLLADEIKKHSFSHATGNHGWSVAVTVYAFIFMWFVVFLALFHCSLLVRGVSTYLFFKHDIMPALEKRGGEGLSVGRRCATSLVEVFCSPPPDMGYERRRYRLRPLLPPDAERGGAHDVLDHVFEFTPTAWTFRDSYDEAVPPPSSYAPAASRAAATAVQAPPTSEAGGLPIAVVPPVQELLTGAQAAAAAQEAAKAKARMKASFEATEAAEAAAMARLQAKQEAASAAAKRSAAAGSDEEEEQTGGGGGEPTARP